MTEKRLIVIGAGISGLVSAIYAQRSGFRALILEKCTTPGGVSTTWKRKGYTFEGGIHWLIGAKEGLPLHDIWTETGALGENNPVFFKDPIYTLVDAAGRVPLYRDLKRLKKFFPEDSDAIDRLCFHVRCFQTFHPVLLDERGLKVRYPRGFHLMEFLKMTPAVLLAPWLMLQSAGHYIDRFRSRRLRTLLQTIVDPEINALSLIYTLSTFSAGDSGYPEGGSLQMARNMADTFTALGGEIRYGTPALQILRKGGRATGVRTAEGDFPADAVIISADARSAIDHLFETPLQDRWARKMREKLVTCQCMFIGLGINADLSEWPRTMVLPQAKQLKVAGLSLDLLTVYNYAREGHYAPQGCTTLTLILPGECYGYWKQAREDGSYTARKEAVVTEIIARLEKAIPAIRDHVAVWDMATPITYQRYCDTWDGSYMTQWLPRRLTPTAPIRYAPGIYFTGQRTSLSGGLPIAATSGRITAQAVCHDFHTEFVSR